MNIEQKHNWYNIKWFKRMAPFYDFVEIFVTFIRKKVASKVIKEKAEVLDVACGTGNQTLAFADLSYRVVGIDLSPDMLNYAKKKVKTKHNISFICCDATKIPFPDSGFDVSSVSFGLHDMPEEIGIKALKEMIRTTKPNGQIIIVDYNKPNNKISAWFGFKIAKLWESKYYDHYMDVGLNHYLKIVKLKVLNKKTHFFGNIQIVECINEK